MSDKIIDFNSKKIKKDTKDTEKLVQLGISIDNVLINYIRDRQLDPKDVAVILGHRLSELLKHLDQDRDLVWIVIQDLIETRIKK